MADRLATLQEGQSLVTPLEDKIVEHVDEYKGRLIYYLILYEHIYDLKYVHCAMCIVQYMYNFVIYVGIYVLMYFWITT